MEAFLADGLAWADDFLVRALLAGVGLALVAAPLGCVVVWRRMAFFGDALAHAGLLGVAGALLLGATGAGATGLGVFIVALLAGAVLYALEGRAGLTGDTVLGILAHGALATAIVALAAVPGVRVDVEALLFGDILTVAWGDVALVWLGGAAILVALARSWNALLALTVSPEVAEAERPGVDRARLTFIAMIAGVVALAVKLVGALLVTALLIVPAATARRFAASPETMAMLAALAGILAVLGGLVMSLTADTPAGPSIVVVATMLFALSLLVRRG